VVGALSHDARSQLGQRLRKGPGVEALASSSSPAGRHAASNARAPRGGLLGIDAGVAVHAIPDAFHVILKALNERTSAS